jgi:hypothetical protein
VVVTGTRGAARREERQDAAPALEAVASVAEVEASEWNGLAAGRSVYSSWEWHRALEDSHPWQARYVLARLSPRTLDAALPVYLADGPANPLYDPAARFGELVRGRLRSPESWFPGVVAGSRAGYSTELLVDPVDGSRRERLVRALCDAVADLGARGGARAAWTLYLPAADAVELSHAFAPHAAVLLVGGESRLDVAWDDFEGYLRHLSTDRRGAVRREMKTFRASGASVALDDLQSQCERLAPLLVAVDRKHGHDTSLSEARRYLRAQSRSLGGLARLFVCHRGRRLIAFALFYEFSGVLHARVVGLDYARAQPGDYFNVLFYAPIRFAIESRLRGVHFGVEAYETKLARGCDFRPLWGVVVRSDAEWAAAVSRVRRWNAARLLELEQRYGALMRRGFPAAEVEPLRAEGWIGAA